jgi:PTH2 family peptidyl-tRNA hydrolase
MGDGDGEVEAGTKLKQVMVVRKELKMGKGKIAAQCCHASLGAYRVALRQNPAYVKAWQWRGQAKIAVSVEGEETLFAIQEAARTAGIPTYLVEDAGHTQVDPGTRTVLGLGPAPVHMLDAITGREGAYPGKLL